MFKSFSWMFKINNFKEHFKYLFLTLFKFLIPSICLSCLIIFDKTLPIIWVYICLFIAILLFIAPFLCVQGYFWELTSNVISREWDVTGSNVYNGKIKQVYKIELPEISTRKFIWRGFASIVANAIMCWPLFVVFSLSMLFGLTGNIFLGTNLFELQSYSIAIGGASILYTFLAPALLWNYAKQDSVVAVLNWRKAIFIAGNYTGKYISNCTLYTIFNALPSYVFSVLFMLLQIYTFDFANQMYLIKFLVLGIVSYTIYIYCVFVNAYLLGTIAPPCEG